MPAYDSADWHADGAFPPDLERRAGGTHIGMFLAWAIVRELEGPAHGESPQAVEAVRAVRARRMTGRELLFRRCDGTLAPSDLSDEGNAFASAYYVRKGEVRYLLDYEATLRGDLSSMYRLADTWENFDRLAPVLDGRFEAWRASR